MTAAYAPGLSSLDTERRIDALPVRGGAPSWLRGALLRAGPAKFEIGADCYRHWFDGLAMLHRFSFRDGRIGYANRFLQSGAWLDATSRNKIIRREFASQPRFDLLDRFARIFDPRVTDNANVNTARFGKDFVALTEPPTPLRFDPETLETLGAYDYGDDLRGHLSIAHPHFDIEARRQYSFVTEFGLTSRYHIYSIAEGDTRRVQLAEIATRAPAYMHSFGMTERYLVLVEFPFVVNPLALRFGSKSFIEHYRWKPQLGALFHVIDKASGDIVRTAQGPAFFAFHHVNAFELGNELAVDIVTFEDARVIDQLYLTPLRAGDFDRPVAGRLTRFRIGLASGADMKVEQVSYALCELPRINDRYAGRRYRFAHAVGNRNPHDFPDCLVKIDLETNSVIFWSQEGCYPGEPVFVAAPASADEDDGVVLSVVLDAPAARSFLLILSAKDYVELARAELPHHIPFGFHGNYFDAL